MTRAITRLWIVVLIWQTIAILEAVELHAWIAVAIYSAALALTAAVTALTWWAAR